MEFIFFIGGAIVGTICTLIFNDSHKTCGLIKIDHNDNTCQVVLTSDELANRKIKKVIFTIDHEADLSREEQVL